MKGQLHGRVAIVGEAGRGIGRGIAEVLARHRADITVTDVSESAINVSSGMQLR